MQELLAELQALGSEEKAAGAARFFKTGKGEYGEGDVFLGVSVPDQRKLAGKYREMLSLEDLAVMLDSRLHEVRLTTVFILVEKFRLAQTDEERQAVVNAYLDNLHGTNNWDLVDSSAHKILGPWLMDRDRSLLYEMAGSGELWQQRIAVITTFHFIRQRQYDDTLKLAVLLMDHPHDLIHKAVGWMLREVGKLDYQVAFDFLKAYYREMPRTMLRYAIERFDPETRQMFLKGEV
jgi:3-methyladenine DNA glycosylase AlkD